LVLDSGRLRAAGTLQQLQTEPGWLQGEEPGVVIEAEVTARDAGWQLLRADFDGGSLQLRDEGQAIGSRLRLRVAARDVGLALQEPQDCSVANRLAVRLERIDADPGHSSQCLALLRAGGTPLLARLTRQSAARLGLQPGMPLWALVKAVALA
jgi:molybdate transport system ATP-binding protein